MRNARAESREVIYSYSLINTFHEVCPRQAYERWWLKCPTPVSAKLTKGNADHKALEKRLVHGNRLPDDLQQCEPICEAFMARGVPVAETKFAVNRALESTGFFDSDCYIRGVSDVKLYSKNDTSVFIGDWKTGKKREQGEPLQLMINAAAEFAETPDAQTVTCANIYTKPGQMGQVHSWKRSELPELWRVIVPLVQEIEQAEAAGKFPERQSPLCAWCPVFHCQHNRNPQRG